MANIIDTLNTVGFWTQAGASYNEALFALEAIKRYRKRLKPDADLTAELVARMFVESTTGLKSTIISTTNLVESKAPDFNGEIILTKGRYEDYGQSGIAVEYDGQNLVLVFIPPVNSVVVFIDFVPGTPH